MVTYKGFGPADTARICDETLALKEQNRKGKREQFAEKYGLGEVQVRATVSQHVIHSRKAAEALLGLRTPRGKKEEWEKASQLLDAGDAQGAIRILQEIDAHDALTKLAEAFVATRPDIAIRAYVAAGEGNKALEVVTRYRKGNDETLRWLLDHAAKALRS